jgi:hypothetical protein
MIVCKEKNRMRNRKLPNVGHTHNDGEASTSRKHGGDIILRRGRLIGLAQPVFCFLGKWYKPCATTMFSSFIHSSYNVGVDCSTTYFSTLDKEH